jgi:hypothetical protein
LGVSGTIREINVKTHLNNHLADNARDAVKAMQDLKKFKFYFSDN